MVSEIIREMNVGWRMFSGRYGTCAGPRSIL